MVIQSRPYIKIKMVFEQITIIAKNQLLTTKHMHTHTRASACTQPRTHAHTLTHAHACTRARTHTLTHTHTREREKKRGMPMYTHTRACIHRYIHTITHAQLRLVNFLQFDRHAHTTTTATHCHEHACTCTCNLTQHERPATGSRSVKQATTSYYTHYRFGRGGGFYCLIIRLVESNNQVNPYSKFQRLT